MRKAIMSLGVFALLFVGVVGCQHESSSGGAMKMSAMPACWGDACKKMGGDCCTADASGKAACSMGGSCCVKK